MPIQYRTYELCLEAVKQNGYALEYVPKKYHDDEIYSAALHIRPDVFGRLSICK